MDIKRTKTYYQRLNIKDMCQCTYCLNYYQEVEKEYPGLSKYLKTFGIDIQKPFETMPLEVDDKGYIEYICAQYIVFGSKIDFKSNVVKGVEINIAEPHPSTDISEEHFVIEISPIRLKWIIE